MLAALLQAELCVCLWLSPRFCFSAAALSLSASLRLWLDCARVTGRSLARRRRVRILRERSRGMSFGCAGVRLQLRRRQRGRVSELPRVNKLPVRVPSTRARESNSLSLSLRRRFGEATIQLHPNSAGQSASQPESQPESESEQRSTTTTQFYIASAELSDGAFNSQLQVVASFPRSRSAPAAPVGATATLPPPLSPTEPLSFGLAHSLRFQRARGTSGAERVSERADRAKRTERASE